MMKAAAIKNRILTLNRYLFSVGKEIEFERNLSYVTKIGCQKPGLM